MSNATLTTLTEAAARALRDSAHRYWSQTDLELAVRQALVLVNGAVQARQSLELSLTAPGPEVALSAELANVPILGAVWPLPPASNRVMGFLVRRALDHATLELALLDGPVPQAGDPLRLEVGRDFTLAGLDGAEQTTLTPRLEGLLLEGACALAADMNALSRAESLNEMLLSSWAAARLAHFEEALERERRADVGRGSRFSLSWPLEV